MAYLRKKYLKSESDIEYNSDINEFISEILDNNKKIPIVKKINKSDDELLYEYNELLKKYWGFDSLKQTQFDIIKKVIEEERDTCAILATGFGKSLCYQLPYLITKKNVIVISPLIALMHEQGNEMKNRNIPTAIFNSEMTTKKRNEEKQEIMNGINKLIFMTPEYFIKSESFIKEIENELSLICIDEAHAVSTWGLDFRPSYTKLGVIREWVPYVPILTLTATAGTKVRQDIYKTLKLKNPELIIGNFDRPNLLIKIEPRHDTIINDIKILIDKYIDEYIIIYCKTRDETEQVSDKINKFGIKCDSYHAGMDDKSRTTVQQDFIDGKIKCICATIAFGMGINISKVRLVIHYNCPKNLESYYQEIGRAGRDGEPSECVLFYSAKDFQVNKYFIQNTVNSDHKKYLEDQQRQIEKYIYTSECRRKIILKNFGQNIESCINCDNCIKATSQINKQKIMDYTREIYLILNILTKFNDKYGFGMCINVLLAKDKKVKDWMKEWEEYGSGLSFGNENWWKELSRHMLTDDILIETQVQGMFGSTIGIAKKGIIIKNKLFTKYPKYLDLLIDKENNISKTYELLQINFPEIKFIETKKYKSSNKISKSKIIKKK